MSNKNFPSNVDMADLKRKSVKGGIVTMTSQLISILIQISSTIILSRFLTPSEYGIIAMVLAITSFAGLFRDLGLSAASIQKKQLSNLERSNLFWLNVGMGTLLSLTVLGLSPMVAWFYNEPKLKSVTAALSLSFLISSFGTQHGANLARNMHFTRQALANITGALTGLCISILFAINNYSYWSLVWGTLGGATITTTMLLCLSDFKPNYPKNIKGIRSILNFGASLTLFDIINYFHRNLDNILIGRYWGPIALGIYSRAYQLLMLPIITIRGPLNTVAFPALSRLQTEPDKFRVYYQHVTAIIAFLSMPLCAFLYCNSKDLVELLLGDQWKEVIPIFSILSIAGFTQPSASLRGSVVIALGQGRKYVYIGLVQAVVTSIGFMIGVHWGAIGVAYSYAISVYITLPILLKISFKNTDIAIMDYFKSVLNPAIASILSSALIISIKANFIIQFNIILRLIIFGGTFMVCYIMIMNFLPNGKIFMKKFVHLVVPKKTYTAVT